MKNVLKVMAVALMVIGGFLIGKNQAAEIPSGYVLMDADDLHDNYIDCEKVEDMITDGDSFTVYTYDGESYYFE